MWKMSRLEISIKQLIITAKIQLTALKMGTKK
jgi:hypothetical protein